MIFELLARLGEDTSQHRGHSQDRRPHVKAKALFLEDCGFAPQPTVALQQDDAISSRGEGARSRKPSQPAAENADPIALSRCHVVYAPMCMWPRAGGRWA